MRANPETTVQIAASYHPSLKKDAAVFLFGDETHEGARFSREELERMFPSYSSLYAEIVDAVARVLNRSLGVPPPAAAVISREAVVAPVHFFMDRLVRLRRLAQNHPGRGLAVLAARERVPADMIEFRALACSSFLFNQAVLVRLAGILSLPCQEPAAPLSEPARKPLDPSAVNLNFLGATVAQRVARKLAATGRRLLGRGRGASSGIVPVLSMAYATEAFKTAGFYGELMQNIQNKAVLADAPAAPAVRRALRDAVASRSEAVARFLDSAGVGDAGIRARAASGLAAFAAEFLPPNLIEAAPANLERCRAVLRPFAPRPLIVAEMCTLEPTYMMAAAKDLGMEVIGCQHGGYYGYVQGHPGIAELEYPHCDRFITWGWDRAPNMEMRQNIRTVPLPSPWLSERRRFWIRTLPPRSSPKAWDALLMCTFLYRFPPAPTSTYVPQPDNLGAITAMLKEVVAACSAEGLSLLYKPGNKATAESTPETLAAMAAAGGSRYGLLDTPHKGLDPAVIRDCACVVWDRLGTGFLECLSAGIPTLAYWPGIFGREEEPAAAAFQGLEAVGLVPTTLPALIAALKEIKASPTGWLSSRDRAAVVSGFLRSYGWTDAGWAGHWRRFLGSSAVL